MDGAKESLPLSLTGFEVVHLADAINKGNATLGLPDKDGYVSPTQEALLLLGSAYRELVQLEGYPKPGSVTLQVREEIVWLFTSKVTTTDLAIDQKTPIGPRLLVKLYGLLLEFNSGFSDLPTPAEDPSLEEEEERKNILDLLTKGDPNVGDVGNGPDPGPNADYLPGN